MSEEASNFIGDGDSGGDDGSPSFIHSDNPFDVPRNELDKIFEKKESKPQKQEAKKERQYDRDIPTSKDAQFDEQEHEEDENREDQDNDEQEEEERDAQKDNKNELKRLKNAVPALQRKTNELMRQNQSLQSKIQSFDQERARVAQETAETVWSKIVENFDEIEDEILKQRGVNPEDHRRDKFLKQVQLETMSDEQRQLYNEKKELERKLKEMEPYQKRVQQEEQRRQEELQRNERSQKLSFVAQHVAKIAEKVGLPKGEDGDTLQMVDMLIEVTERAKRDPMFAQMTDTDVVSHYADQKWQNHISFAKNMDWDKIDGKPGSQEYLQHCERIVRAASLKNGGSSVRRIDSGKMRESAPRNNNSYISEAQMMAELRGRLSK